MITYRFDSLEILIPCGIVSSILLTELSCKLLSYLLLVWTDDHNWWNFISQAVQNNSIIGHVFLLQTVYASLYYIGCVNTSYHFNYSAIQVCGCGRV